MRAITLITVALLAAPALAGPVAPAGDIGLRHDLQMLADYGALGTPVTHWPVAWDAVRADLQAATDAELVLPVAVQNTLERILARAGRETERGTSKFNLRLAGSVESARIRGYSDTPRDEGELQVGYSWAGEHVSVDLNATGVANPDDEKDVRPDGSRLAVDWGNVTFAASTMDRWWGPGWDGSLILSNNARPIPALTISRNETHAFRSKWLRWIGPWDVDVIFGQMEHDRAVPDARFFGMRVTFRPHRSLEIGLSRSAQWCGEGRPCDGSTFWDLFAGKDNRGDDGTTPENEPGNQLAGIDIRWSNLWLGQPSAIYTQWIAEDEAGGFPSRYMAQLGIETSGYIRNRWSYRWYAEVAGTSCDFRKDDIFNCAYNHGIYETGYRYQGRAIGHGLDNDAKVTSTGLILVNDSNVQWHALFRAGDLNRGGAPDARNTLSPTPLEIASVDLFHSRPLGKGRIEFGLGYERLEDPVTGVEDSDTRAFIAWRNR